jgi:replicative DNA helicase
MADPNESSNVIDLADRLKAGQPLPTEPGANVEPVNERAKRAAEDRPRILTVSEILQDAGTRAMQPLDNRRHLTTCHFRLDDAAGGIRPPLSWLVGASTSWGKSSWAIAIADDNIKAGKTVLIVSTEDDESLYGDRLLARRSGVNAKRIRDRKCDKDDMAKITEQMAKAERQPIYLDARSKTVEWIVEKVDVIIREHNVHLVIYDYLQEIRAKRRHQDTRLMFKHIANELRHVCKNNKIPSMILSQITEQLGKVTRPDKNSIRECRDVSNAADVIVLGYTPNEGDEEGQHKLFIDKIKNGPRGFMLTMDWDAEVACFKTVKDPADAAYEQFDRETDGFQDGL